MNKRCSLITHSSCCTLHVWYRMVGSLKGVESCMDRFDALFTKETKSNHPFLCPRSNVLFLDHVQLNLVIYGAIRECSVPCIVRLQVLYVVTLYM